MKAILYIGATINGLFLSVLMLVVGFLTAFSRNRENIPATAEDAMFYKNKGTSTDYEGSKVERFRRIHQNHIENYIPFMIAAYLFINNRNSTVAGGLVEDIAGCILFSVFTISRILYTICYAFSLQPWRTLAFFAGHLVTGTLVIWSLVTIWIAV